MLNASTVNARDIGLSLFDAMSEDNPSRAGDEALMDRALDEARRAERMGEVPVGAVVALDGRVIAAEANAPIATNDPTAHAEIRALRAAAARLSNYRLTGATLYVTLEPCAMCAAALVHARIRRLVFGCDDPRTGAAGSLYDIPRDGRLNHRVQVAAGIRGAESSAILRRFFQKRRP